MQTFFIDALIEDKLTTWWYNKFLRKNKTYVRIEDEMANSKDWMSADFKHGASIVDLMRLENAAFVPEDDDDSDVNINPTDSAPLVAEKTNVGSASTTEVDVDFRPNLMSQMSIESCSSSKPIFEIPQPDYEDTTSDFLLERHHSTTTL